MTDHRLQNFTSFINLDDRLEIAIEKSRAILDFMIMANLKEHTTKNIHLCLVSIEEILENARS